MFYVYILKSKLNNQLYAGSTNDLVKRFQDHNDGRVISTKRYKPWLLIYYEAYKTEKLARIREKRLKYNGNAMRELKKRIGILKSGAGFSLIEILVAVSIFAIVAVISSGALLSASDAQQKILSLRVVQDNLSYVFDIMGKEVRTGRSYHCGISADDFSDIPRDCASPGGPSFTFRNSAGDKITYRINSGRIEKVLNGNPASSLVLTSSDANITSLTFYVVGAPANDHLQPRLTIVLRGTAGLKEKLKSRLNIQTTISQRMIDS